MEIYKKHEDKGRENEFELYLAKVKRAIKKSDDGYLDALTLEPGNEGKNMLEILKETGNFSYNCDGVVYDFIFGSHLYIYIAEDWMPKN